MVRIFVSLSKPRLPAILPLLILVDINILIFFIQIWTQIIIPLHQIHLLRHRPGVVMASTLAITTITTPQQQIVELGCLHKIRMQPMKQAKILPQGQKMLDIIISRVPRVFM